MNATPIKEQILQEVDKLGPAQQAQLLHIARHMQKPQTLQGTPGEIMLAEFRLRHH
jgi:hypothetical protein